MIASAVAAGAGRILFWLSCALWGRGAGVLGFGACILYGIDVRRVGPFRSPSLNMCAGLRVGGIIPWDR